MTTAGKLENMFDNLSSFGKYDFNQMNKIYFKHG